MISDYNKTKSLEKRNKLGKEIFRKEIQIFKNIYQKRYLPLKQIFGKIDKIEYQSQGSVLFYKYMIEYLISGLRNNSVKLTDLNFEVVKNDIKLAPLWKGLLLAQKKELDTIIITREKKKYNISNIRKTV